MSANNNYKKQILDNDIQALKDRIKSLEDMYRHTHQANYITVGDKDILTEECDKCGRNFRDEIHAQESK